MKAEKKYLGVKYRLGRTGQSRFSAGRLHLLFWSKENKMWVLNCRPSNTSGMYSYNLTFPTEVSNPMPTTCLLCDPMIKRVFL